VVVAPNTIDFNTVFTEEKFLESAPVFATVVIVITLYIVALVLCRRQDKKDPLRVNNCLMIVDIRCTRLGRCD
jgi:hypothetical protein